MATTSGCVRRVAAPLLIALIALAAFAARPAAAEPRSITGGETALRVNIHTFLKIVNAGIFATAIPPARLEFGATPTVYFPVRSGGAADVENSLVLVMHDGGLRMQKDPVTLDTTNLTINCTSLTGCRLLGTANQVLPNEVATIESVTMTDDEAGTVRFDGIAVIPETTALALNTLFSTDAFAAGDQLGVIQATFTYDATEPGGYARPKSAGPVQVSLVPAYDECLVPNREHGPPLAEPSCNPPSQASAQATVGTPDSNGQAARAIAHARFKPTIGDPDTPEDEADVAITVSANDVRAQSDLSDYAGELQASVSLRLTDRNNSLAPPVFPDDQTGTVQDTTFAVTVPCTASGDPDAGADCELSTSADAVTPGLVVEGDRAIWQLGQVQLFDGGVDGDAETTADNTLFATQGIFIP
jgi:hypothetical protein